MLTRNRQVAAFAAFVAETHKKKAEKKAKKTHGFCESL